MNPKPVKQYDFDVSVNAIITASRFFVLQAKNGEVYFLLNQKGERKIELYKLKKGGELELLLSGNGYLYSVRPGGRKLSPLFLLDETHGVISCLASDDQATEYTVPVDFQIVEFDLKNERVQYIHIGTVFGNPQKLERFENGEYLLAGARNEYSQSYFEGYAPVDCSDYLVRIAPSGECFWYFNRRRKKTWSASEGFPGSGSWMFGREGEVINAWILSNQNILIEEWENEFNEALFFVDSRGKTERKLISFTRPQILRGLVTERKEVKILTYLSMGGNYEFQLKKLKLNDAMNDFKESVIIKLSDDQDMEVIDTFNCVITVELLNNGRVLTISQYRNCHWEKQEFIIKKLSSIREIVFDESSEKLYLLGVTEKNHIYRVIGISKTNGIFLTFDLKATEDCRIYAMEEKLLLTSVECWGHVKIELLDS